MELILYSINDGRNVLNKTLVNPTNISIVLKADTDITSPVLMLEQGSGIDYKSFNYCHIPSLNRFYFVNSVDNMNASIYRLYCETDVLMTYKDDILSSLARVRRGIRNGDYMNAVIETSVMKSVSKFESDKSISDNKSLIITTVGE